MDWDTLSRLMQMVLGVGLVIFVHELGHFLAARLCGVRVDVFSLGFGPRLLGWRRGETLYQVAALPIGGFCRMAGEEPTGAGEGPQPYELRAKPVGQRFFIYSGGVLMNIAFAAIVLPLVLFHGVPFLEPVIGRVEPGGSAWHARIEPGTRVLAVNGEPIASFEYIAQEIALGPPDEAELRVLESGASEPRTVRVQPRYEEEIGIRMIGVAPGEDSQGAVYVTPGSPAAKAGLSDADRVAGVESDLPGLTLQQGLADASSRAEPLRLTVLGPDGSRRSVAIEPSLEEVPEARILGISPVLNVVSDRRPNEDVSATGLQVGDRIVRANGRRILRERDLARALSASDQPLRIDVERDGRRLQLGGPALDRERALAFADDVALDRSPTRFDVVLHPAAAAANVLKDGDRILAADGLEAPHWERQFLPAVREAVEKGRAVQLRIERESDDGAVEQLEVSATAGPQKVVVYGVLPREATYVYQASSVGEAIHVGFQGTWKFATDTWMMIKRMVLGQVSSKNMGGIISIGVMSYTLAEQGLAKLLFFLCLLSVNLAIINVLPIPLLDGGHLFFLVIEKIKGSPVSERVFGYSQVVGLVLILTLLIYVTYNDVMRFLS